MDLDTFERVSEEDLKQCAIVIASAVYHLAMREAMLPRFDGESMPEQQSPVASRQCADGAVNSVFLSIKQ